MKRSLLLLFSLVTVFSLQAQKRNIPVKEYFTDAEFFLIQEEYVDALSDYLVVLKKGYEHNANINYRIGICYLNIPGQKDLAIHYLEKASVNASEKYRESSLNEMYAPLDVYLYLGNAYRVNYQLDTAIVKYNKYLELLADKSVETHNYVNKQIEACYIAKEFIENPKKVSFDKLGTTINNNNSNYNAVMSADGTTLAFMSKLPFYDGVFVSRKRGENWARALNITPQIESDGDQVVTGISSDGNTILLVKEDIFNSDIYISHFENGQWEKSKPISKNINTKYWESHASFSPDDKTIYFTSNMKGGLGAMDIYKSELDENNNWGIPVNLGAGVNTPLNEDTPFATSDGKLYYSSQGHRNMGGYDYFVSEFNDSAWVNPQNLQYPLSTPDEDIFYYPVNNGETALVHKIMEDGYGGFDIYKVSFPTEVEVEDAIADQITEDLVEEEEGQLEQADSIILEIEPVLFAFDNSKLSAKSKKQIAVLIQLMKDNSELNIKIVGHTDALGPKEYNLQLSKRRAQEVATYFTNNGIEENRIEVIGKGESEFIAINKTSTGYDSPEGRRYNRRVEFEILGFDSNFYFIKKINNVPLELQYK